MNANKVVGASEIGLYTKSQRLRELLALLFCLTGCLGAGIEADENHTGESEESCDGAYEQYACTLFHGVAPYVHGLCGEEDGAGHGGFPGYAA